MKESLPGTDTPKNVNRSRIRFLISILLAFIALKMTLGVIEALKVMEFAFLLVIIGLTPAYLLKNTLEYDNIVSWFTNAAAISLIFVPLFFLLNGFLGINFVFSYQIPILYIFAISSLLYVTFFIKNNDFLSNVSIENMGSFDKTAYILIFFFFCILTLMNFDRIDPRWDTFTFWGVDAKFIFENLKLRGPDFNLLWRFEYTSFIPILYAAIYKFYNAILEQYASWINVFIVLVSMNMVYATIRKSSLISKLIGLTFLFWAVYASIEAAYMFSVYADIFCAFLVLLFGIILIKPYQQRSEITSQRSFMLAVILVTSYFVKEPNIYVSAILLLVWLGFDLWIYKGKVIELAKTRQFWFSMLFVTVLLVLRYLYFNAIGHDNFHASLVPDMVARDSLFDYLKYLSTIFVFFMTKYPYTLIILALGLASIVIRPKRLIHKPTWLALFLICVLLSGFFIAGYTLQNKSFTSGSISRYLSILTFLIPILPAFAITGGDEINNRNSAELVLVPLFIFLAFIKVMIPMPLHREFSLKPGTYQSSSQVESSYQLAQKVTSIVGDEAKILITDDLFWGSSRKIISNTNEPAIYIRYYLLNQSVGGQYNLNESMLFSYAIENDADYILVLNNDFLFYDCGDVYEMGANFLLDMDSVNSESPSCSLLGNNVILLD